MISRASLFKLGTFASLHSQIPSRISLLPSTTHLSRRTFKSTSIHQNSPQTPPQEPQHPPKPSFKPFQRPFFKVFLGAIFTYQVWYWAWTKLEMDDLKAEKQEELSSLENKARDLASKSS